MGSGMGIASSVVTSLNLETGWGRGTNRSLSDSVEAVRQTEVLESGGQPARIGGLLGHPRHHLAGGILDGPGDECRDVADLVAAKGQDVEREGHEALLVGVPAVVRQGHLPVRLYLKRTPAPVARERPAGQEGGDLLVAAEPA